VSLESVCEGMVVNRSESNNSIRTVVPVFGQEIVHRAVQSTVPRLRGIGEHEGYGHEYKPFDIK
jgi:hypothetical protein